MNVKMQSFTDDFASFANDDFLSVKQKRQSFFESSEFNKSLSMDVDSADSIRIKKTHQNAMMPTYHNDCAAGFDLYLCEDLILLPLEQKLIGSGLCFEIPAGYYGQIAEKSSIALAGISIHGGIIDSDYRGEVRILLHNRTSSIYRAPKGSKIAQMIILPYQRCKIYEVDELSNTDRGQRGFGGRDLTNLK